LSNLDRNSIAAILVEKGAMGVTALATELDVPVSSLQRYLVGQKYFKQTDGRKWDTPERFQANTELNTLSKMANNAKAGLELTIAQHEDMLLRLTNTLDSINILMKGIEGFEEPKAKSSSLPVADSRLADLDKGSKTLREAIKQNRKNIPAEYYELVLNYDSVDHLLTVGRDAARNFLDTELAPIILDGATELPEETIATLKEHQR
jgi:hypothetical protein